MKKKLICIFSALGLAAMLSVSAGCGLSATQDSPSTSVNPFSTASTTTTTVSTTTNTTEATSNVTSAFGLPRFTSEEELVTAFTEGSNQGSRGDYYTKGGLGRITTAVAAAAPEASAPGVNNNVAYSDTNVQVAGVDEADIVKTDGRYIYVMAQNSLYLAQAYPVETARILSHIVIPGFSPQELFIDQDRLLVFGTTYYTPADQTVPGQPGYPTTIQPGIAKSNVGILPYPTGGNLVSIKLYDIQDRANPKLLKSVDIEGSYLTSRKIGTDVYFVINSYPSFNVPQPLATDIIPGYQEVLGNAIISYDLKPIANFNEIGYIPPRQAANFITVASLSMSDATRALSKEVIVGSGENVYASLANLYIAQTSWPTYDNIGQLVGDNVQTTVITKFALSNGSVTYTATGEIKGHILNQFAMDEYDGYFRIATTISGYVDNRDTSTNNVYVLDATLKATGALEDVAPGESIYAVRFMGKRAYLVTFLHVDPLFVIDLSQPAAPQILGKLKIPGYSDYLQPYDETHLIGIGKEVDASIDADLIHTENAVYYTAIQGVKLSLFDVSDVSNPIEVYKEVIGDRGTESLATQDHKAFLFDKARGLLVIPVTVAELQPGQAKNMQGEFVFQGAYVYNLTLENGFTLKGKVTHYDSSEAFQKSGEYFYGGDANITRSLYIENILYTLSQSRLQLNDLTSLATLQIIPFGQ
jgi:inhibitor of cysteine peptidase